MENGRRLHAVPLRPGRTRPVSVERVRHSRMPSWSSGADDRQHHVLRTVVHLRMRCGQLSAGSAMRSLLPAAGAAGRCHALLPAVPVPSPARRLLVPPHIERIAGTSIRGRLRSGSNVGGRRLRPVPLRGGRVR